MRRTRRDISAIIIYLILTFLIDLIVASPLLRPSTTAVYRQTCTRLTKNEGMGRLGTNVKW